MKFRTCSCRESLNLCERCREEAVRAVRGQIKTMMRPSNMKTGSLPCGCKETAYLCPHERKGMTETSNPPMAPIRDAACDHWVEHTSSYYEVGDLHVSHFVLQGFEAGAKWALGRAEQIAEDTAWKYWNEQGPSFGTCGEEVAARIRELKKS